MDELIKKKLLEKAKKGDIESFTCLFEFLRPALYAKAVMFLGYGNEAKDAVQETFIAAFSKMYQLNKKHKFNTWIHTILKNQCLLIKRNKKRFASTDHLLQFKKEHLPTQYSTEDFLIKQNLNDHLLEVIAQLEEKKRVVVLLRFYSEYNSYNEIAQIMNIPVGTVRSRLSLAKKELQADISKGKDMNPHPLLEPGADNYDNGISEAWAQLYRGDRTGFLSHFDHDIQIRFSSGKQDRGIQRWAREWDALLKIGLRFNPNHVVNSGNLTIVEGPIIKPPDKPNHWPSEAGFVLFHKPVTIYKIHLHYTSRK